MGIACHAGEERSPLQRLLRPRQIAFIGGTNLTDAIHSTVSIGYRGEIWVVNPKYNEIAGYHCYRSLADLPGVPDAAFIAINKRQTIATVKELSDSGAGGAVCYAAGFAEIGEEGRQLQNELVAASGNNLALVGPNCYGILNYLDGVALWPDRHGGAPLDTGVAFISQSGNIALNLTMTDRSCPLAYVVSIGNQAVLSVHDFIDAFLDDTRIRAIGLYLEGLTDIAAFSRSAVRALEKGIPIIVFKVGASPIGKSLALSHTSSLAGSDEFYSALFSRLGVIRVDSLTHLTETLKLCSYSGVPQGTRLTVLTFSGGDSAIAADFADAAGLTLPRLTENQLIKLREQLPDFVSLSNPLDYNTGIWGKPQELERCFGIALDSNEVDSVILLLDFPKKECGDRDPWYHAAEALVRAVEGGRSGNNNNKIIAVASVIPELLPEDVRKMLADAGIAPLQGIWRALKSLADTGRYNHYRKEMITHNKIQDLLMRSNIWKDGFNADSVTLDEYASKSELAAFSLPVPLARIGRIHELIAHADDLGYPVALKISSSQLPHKTEMGAVKLNLGNAIELESAALEIMNNLEKHGIKPPAEGFHFLIEKMVTGAVAELIIGIKRDPQFGLVMIIGSGGIFVELIKDSSVILLPTSPDAIRKALQSLKLFPLLQGFRGRDQGDVDAVIEAVMSVAAYAENKYEEILEVDINPLLVLPMGKGVLAVDALVRKLVK